MKLLKALGALVLILAPALVAAKDGPDVKQTKFDGNPYKLSFFEDSETALVIDDDRAILYRTTDAGKEWQVPDGPTSGEAIDIVLHPRDASFAVVIGSRKTHWVTTDQGKSWKQFHTPDHPSLRDPITFHWTDNKRMLFHTFDEPMLTRGIGKTYWTTDGFVNMDILHARRETCTWAKTTDRFTTGDPKKDLDRTLCVVEGKYSMMMKDYKLLVSDDFFEHTHEPELSKGRTVTGVINVAPVKGFIVAAAKVPGSQELALFVTKDTDTWHRAEFGDHQLKEDAYTILESTNYSIQVQVTPDHDLPIGALFSSNSNGTYFRRIFDHVHRNERGIMDFEKLENIQGTFLINEISNWEELQKEQTRGMVLKSKLTIDDGQNFEGLRSGNDDLHVHSVTELRNSGRVFSSPAPGIVMGNGNTGGSLLPFDRANLYISDDGGKHWIKADLDGPQKYEFGDQGSVLVAVKDNNEPVEEAAYSLNHGKSWTKFGLGKKIRPFELTTIRDATSLKFILTGRDDDGLWWAISIDLEGLHERKCKSNDFEDWYARKDDKGEPLCIMGHKQHFRRRKADAECIIGEEFREALPESVQCDCTDKDFECDFNFKRTSDGTCVPIGRILDPDNKCKTREGTFMATSGWRQIPGNDCKRLSGKQKDDPVQRPCTDVFAPPATGEITKKFNTFRGEKFASMYYLERGGDAKGIDETIVLLTTEMEALITHDHGKNWAPAIPGEKTKIRAIYPHQYNNDHVYFITPSKKVYYSQDRGHNVHSFDAPDIPNARGLPVLSFHEKNPEWLLWTGNQDCSMNDHANCHTTAHMSTKGGEGDWKLLMPWVKRCQFMYREGRVDSENLIFCEHWESENVQGQLQLLSTRDGFDHYEHIFENMVAFATMAEFVVVAAKSEDGKWLSASASVDGSTFAHAAFPPGFRVEHQSAYTVLDSNTNAVFLHVTENGQRDQEYGTILKSNTNGTSYVLSINHVNRNGAGYVDWEKMQGLEGVAIVNIVANAEEVKAGDRKHLKTMISHDDGAFWSYLPCPEKDLEGNSYKCGSEPEKRALHLHGYTERRDSRETYSSPSAVGIMIGVGNVGERLGLYNEGDTFMTKDGGITWKPIMKGTYMWEYGDQGSVIVLVQRHTPTKDVYYSTDEGESWKKYEFDGDGLTQVDRITTVPSDNSRQFVLWGKKDGELAAVNLDFTGLTDKQCHLDKENVDDPKSDYELWSPQHPHKTTDKECLFGHVSRYYRKKPLSNCYNGPLIDRLHDIERNCTCTRQDFEW
jgi:hypothetical protein